jgi:formate--tetrahydrofolate ligase
VRGSKNLERHIENIKKFGIPVLVAINHFMGDTEAEIESIKDYCLNLGVETFVCKHWQQGSKGIIPLANKVVELAESGKSSFKTLYEDSLSLWEKVDLISKSIYGASEIVADKSIRDKFRNYEDSGFGNFPICMAKTQYSFSTDPNLKGAPSGHVVAIRDVKISAGAEFLIVITGEVMTMPGLPAMPAAMNIKLNSKSEVEGLF